MPTVFPTVDPTTTSPSSSSPSSSAPSTLTPSTSAPSTLSPTTSSPSRVPTVFPTGGPTTTSPSTSSPSTTFPSRVPTVFPTGEPTTTSPSSSSPSTTSPSEVPTVVPTVVPTTSSPSSSFPTIHSRRLNADPNLYDCSCNATEPTFEPTQLIVDDKTDKDGWTNFFTSYLSDYPVAGVLIILSPFLLGVLITYVYLRCDFNENSSETHLSVDDAENINPHADLGGHSHGDCIASTSV